MRLSGDRSQMTTLRRLLLHVTCSTSVATVAWAATQSIELSPGAAVTFETEVGEFYQVERSSDMAQWDPIGSWFPGDGSTFEWAEPLHGPAQYYRMTHWPVANLNDRLEALRGQTELPAIAAAVIVDGQVVGVGAVGTRRFGMDAPVTLEDRWHLGSITKSMTATVAGMLVEEGLIEWDTTLGEVFPEKAGAMVGDWSDSTLLQLLSNSGGAPADLNSSGIWATVWNFKGRPRAARALLLDEVTARAPAYAPGSGNEYSNAGFAMAGHMLEEVADQSWESLVQKHLYQPLGMASGGFGVPATPRMWDEPVGHSESVRNPTIWDPSENADNPTAIGPAATAHASILDLARYAQFHLRGARGETGPLLATSTFETLHTSHFGYQYALGWGIYEREWAGGTALHHTGSNTQWYASVWLAPEVNWAVVVCTNFGGYDAAQKVDTIVGALLADYAPGKNDG
jgi:CubicO group peptidase (beta-lactamase class C family)